MECEFKPGDHVTCDNRYVPTYLFREPPRTYSPLDWSNSVGRLDPGSTASVESVEYDAQDDVWFIQVRSGRHTVGWAFESHLKLKRQ